MPDQSVRLSDWARIQGRLPSGAWKWAHVGKMPVRVVKMSTGRYLVMTESAPAGMGVVH